MGTEDFQKSSVPKRGNMFNNYEIVEYTHSRPFQIQNFTGRTIQDDRGDIKDVLEHWHQEIEMPHAGDYVLLSYHSIQEINQVPTY